MSSITVEHIFKKYRLYDSRIARIKELLHPFKKRYHREFWALRDVSFAVERGTTLGIVGKNGAGKSTLLYLIANIMEPTQGRVAVQGRMAMLLDLAAGFHREFTGRQNVLLNGSLMGFSLKEMKQRLPMIAEFAEIGAFLDQPVKTYSAGMFLRLAFSTAIHVDPDILIIDEILAVGDAKFQYKCYQKIQAFQKQGKTIIFVTHDTNMILRHCNRALLLHQGELIEHGKPADVVNRYLSVLENRSLDRTVSGAAVVDSTRPEQAALSLEERIDRFLQDVPVTDQCPQRASYNRNEYPQSSQRARIVDYLIVGNGNADPTALYCGDKIDLYVKVRFEESIAFPVFGLSVKTVDGLQVYGINTQLADKPLVPVEAGEMVLFKFTIEMQLHPGDYFLDLGVDEATGRSTLNSLERRCDLIHLSVLETKHFDGLVYLATDFAEVARKKTAKASE
jgi:ABC-type polysaccharide/polyol phosphate transport system ATPase subunit